MRIIKVKNYDEMSQIAAFELAELVRAKPDCVLGLATGSTPEGTYKELIRQHREEGLDFSQVRSVNLDEYIGLSPTNENSYRGFMNEKLFKGINIELGNTHVPNGMASDLEAECAAYDELIRAFEGADCQVLGIGVNGHIGFNEPDEVFTVGTHVVELDESTIEANKRFFESEADVPRRAVTMGIGGIMSAKSVLLLACGENKAEALRLSFGGEVSPKVPASVLLLHPNVTVIADEAALSKLI